MNDDSAASRTNSEDTLPLLPWSECDFFCIHDYAGTGKSPCGWRGQLHDTRPDEAATKLLCPRCGFSTLFRIPLASADERI